MAIGLGFESLSFHHNGEFVELFDNNNVSNTQLIPLSSTTNVMKNKYAVNYVDIPVEFRIRTINKTLEDRMKFNFKLYLGFRTGVWLMTIQNIEIMSKRLKSSIFLTQCPIDTDLM